MLVVLSPKGIITAEAPIFVPKAPYELLSYQSTKMQVRAAVVAEFGERMASIVDCESKFNLKAKNINTNGSIDWGLFQINSVHVPNAFKLGIDLQTIEGQFEYARYLIKRNGTRDWVCSRKVV